MFKATTKTALFLLAGLALACGSTSLPGSATDPLVAHEWGTFTSVQASDGRDIDGLLHEDEPPPSFVFRRALTLPGSSRAGERLAENVTQRMETPVIYFHSTRERDVKVEVLFPEGLVTEWFPNAAAFLPAIAPVSASVMPALGSMTWDVRLVPNLTGLPSAAADYVFVPARNVLATPLHRIGAPHEKERFIFYRGVGRFKAPFSVRGGPNRTLELRNAGDETIPAAFLLDVGEGKGRVTPLGPIAKGSRGATALPRDLPLDDYVVAAAEALHGSLRATGLYDDEARAMVNTWSKSYFQTPGLRVLYVLPRAWTDAILPIRITPAPTELVRTLVGRIEVLLPDEEAALAAEVEASAQRGGSMDLAPLGAFAEPKLRRARELVTSEAARSLCDQLLQRAIDVH